MRRIGNMPFVVIVAVIATADAHAGQHDLIENEAAAYKMCPSTQGSDGAARKKARECQAEAFYKTPFYLKFAATYRVQVRAQELGGVYTESFLPSAGVRKGNEGRVLINLHAGSFDHGARYIGRVESMPIAAIGGIEVISVDYRMAPDWHFPAASEDVAAVYTELLKTYSPKNIGIYGCSAGGLLTAQAIAWFQAHGLPLPGAIGMFCSGAGYFDHDENLESSRQDPYFKKANPADPLVFPIRSKELMRQFPPSLLISSTGDSTLDTVAHTHSVLVSQGAVAELHVWPRLGHGFFEIDPELAESHEVFDVITKFFDRYLGK